VQQENSAVQTLDEQQKSMIKRRVRGKTEEEKWREIYHIIFSCDDASPSPIPSPCKTAPPPSPYPHQPPLTFPPLVYETERTSHISPCAADLLESYWQQRLQQENLDLACCSEMQKCIDYMQTASAADSQFSSNSSSARVPSLVNSSVNDNSNINTTL